MMQYDHTDDRNLGKNGATKHRNSLSGFSQEGDGSVVAKELGEVVSRIHAKQRPAGKLSSKNTITMQKQIGSNSNKKDTFNFPARLARVPVRTIQPQSSLDRSRPKLQFFSVKCQLRTTENRSNIYKLRNSNLLMDNKPREPVKRHYKAYNHDEISVDPTSDDRERWINQMSSRVSSSEKPKNNPM